MLGEIISHYRIDREIGSGGMGVVYLAQDTKLHRPVAVKFLPAGHLNDETRRRRFLTEARAASALSHPNVCVIHEVNETGEGHPYIVMEYVEGVPLDRWIDRRAVDLRQVLDIGIQVAEALEGAWEKRIVHRDIKPSNIVISEKGRLKVLDFGVARMQSEGAVSRSRMTTIPGQIVGTPQYMSPEQALGREVNVRSDLFSLGVVLYEMACGRRPFIGQSAGEILNQVVNRRPDPPSRVQESVPVDLDRIILKCLEKNPDYRYQNPTDLLVDLRKIRRESEATEWSVADTELQDGHPSEAFEIESGLADSEVAKPPSAEVVAKSDIFIHCSQVDDRVVDEGQRGWVSDFKRHLELRIEQLTGEQITACLHAIPAGEPEIDQELIVNLPSVKAMLSIVSPPFAKSSGCRREVESFWEHAIETGGRWVNNRSRLFQVIKSPVDRFDLPAPLSGIFQTLQPFEFFEQDPETGRVRHYDEAFGPIAKQKYFERVYDLSQEVCRVLKDLRSERAHAGSEPGKIIYLAVSSSDVAEDWERLKRELTERGHRVLPDRPMPVGGPEVRVAVQDWLRECDISVHLVGSRYGYIPEEADCSIVELQSRLAADQLGAAGERHPARRYIWMPRRLQASDHRQQTFIRSILDDEATHRSAEVIQDSLENFKDLLLDHLKPKPPARPKPECSSPAAQGPPKVYLLFDPRDAEAVEPIEDYLFNRGIELLTLSPEEDESDMEATHRRHLLICDAVLIFYGHVSRSWVEMKLMDLLQAPGYGRERPFLARFVYLAPPFDRRKERFRSHVAETVHAAETFDAELLQPFLGGLDLSS